MHWLYWFIHALMDICIQCLACVNNVAVNNLVHICSYIEYSISLRSSWPLTSILLDITIDTRVFVCMACVFLFFHVGLFCFFEPLPLLQVYLLWTACCCNCFFIQFNSLPFGWVFIPSHWCNLLLLLLNLYLWFCLFCLLDTFVPLYFLNWLLLC